MQWLLSTTTGLILTSAVRQSGCAAWQLSSLVLWTRNERESPSGQIAYQRTQVSSISTTRPIHVGCIGTRKDERTAGQVAYQRTQVRGVNAANLVDVAAKPLTTRPLLPARKARQEPPEGLTFETAVETVGVGATAGTIETGMRCAPDATPFAGVGCVRVVSTSRVIALNIREVKESLVIQLTIGSNLGIADI